MRRVGIFGWGLVAPQARNIERFAAKLAQTTSWLEPFNGFGPDNFLVGRPEFDFSEYQDWIIERHSPNRYRQLAEKMDASTQYAIGAFIQSLQQNPGIEIVLRDLKQQARVYLGTGLGSIPTLQSESVALYKSQRRWNRYWSDPERNAALRQYLHSASMRSAAQRPSGEVPAHPDSLGTGERDDAEDAWWSYWAARSAALQEFLAELRSIEQTDVEGEVEAAKLRVIRDKRRAHTRLIEKWGCPEPPWNLVSANTIWNIPNTPASQVSMLGKITGLAFAPVAACSTFGVALKLAMDAIRHGEAKAVVVGATDPPPHPLVVGAFYNARVLAADGAVSRPLTGLRGTHVSGGSVVWLVCDYAYMLARGMRALGMEPLAVGVSADADHIITPSRAGPTAAMHAAFAEAAAQPNQVDSWDLHATATPGDYMEIETLNGILPDTVLVTARKGTFGHGMSAGGGWELTAQYLGYARGEIFPTPLSRQDLNAEIARLRQRFVFETGCKPGKGLAGKLSMGVGGINACILSRPLNAPDTL